MSNKRNFWSNEETNVMLKIMAEKNAIKLFDGKVFRNSEIYKCIQQGYVDTHFNPSSTPVQLNSVNG